MIDRWRIVPDFVLYWRLWEDQYIVYNSGSGHTHVLDPLTAFLIQQITKHDCGTAELIQQLRALLDIEVKEESDQKLRQTLLRLEQLGLIEALTA